MSISRHVPQRTCIACRRIAAKKELIRIVASDDGVKVDESGRRQGRGAYICLSFECLDKAINRGKIVHALKCGLSPQDQQGIVQYYEQKLDVREFKIGTS